MCENEVMSALREAREIFWQNPGLRPFSEVKDALPLGSADIDDAEARLLRFAPFIRKRFPETEAQGGLIESPLREIPSMKAALEQADGGPFPGRLFLKMDSHLPIAGSVKARGGIYEVLKHSEDLAAEHGLLQNGGYELFDSEPFRAFFHRYAIHVGSTGNLGLSIGTMSAALGYRAVVHMSADARQWKKDLLRSRGVTVVEYASDYSRAVEEGRRLTAQDPAGYFVDDENSADLFLGYAVAARRLAVQLREQGIPVDHSHPLFVYIPCGVGGAPGGITFGLKHEFGDDVFCVFAEPTQAPCMLLGMATGLHNAISVQDIGLSGKTAADGLAVGRPSGFVGKAMEHLLAGSYTIDDHALFVYLNALWEREGLFIEPSACAAFRGPSLVRKAGSFGLSDDRLQGATHIVWATGGSLVPEAERRLYLIQG